MTSTTIARLMNNESMCRRIRSMSRTMSARKIATQLRTAYAGWAVYITAEEAEWFVDAVLCDDLADA
jgi:hypothetical protein